jgi:ATP-dependent DNA helicase RecG
LYRAPLGALSRARLNAIRETNDGFVIAQRDLELRGPGELLGTRQTGLARMRVADLVRDHDLLPRVQQAAELILAQHPDRIEPLTTRWIGSDDKYGRIG